MLIKKPAVCGTLESSDVQITIRPNEGNGIRIELDSVVKTIFGDEIIRTVQEVLNEFEVRDADISLVGQGGARLRDTFPDAGRHTQSLRGAIRLVEGGRAMENGSNGEHGQTVRRSGLKRTSHYAGASGPVNMIQAAFYE